MSSLGVQYEQVRTEQQTLPAPSETHAFRFPKTVEYNMSCSEFSDIPD